MKEHELIVCAMTPEILGLNYYVQQNANLTIRCKKLEHLLEEVLESLELGFKPSKDNHLLLRAKDVLNHLD